MATQSTGKTVFLAVLATVYTIGAVFAWLWLSGHAFSVITFWGKGEPAHLLTWVDYCGAYWGVPSVRLKLMLTGGLPALILLAPYALFALKPRRSLHGEARFANLPEINKSGLLKGIDDGIIVGRLPGRAPRYLTASLDKYPHVMLAAPTGSGKGVGIVIPNLLHWNHSIIVLDIKCENWRKTAGFRQKHGHEVYLFDPVNPKRMTHRWNPLAYVREDQASRIDDIQRIANILFPDISGTDPIWTASCRSLFLGIVLYLFETDGKPRTLGQVAREAFAPRDKRFKLIILEREEAGSPLSLQCQLALSDYMNTSENTRTSIRKTFTSRFDLFLNPNIDAATAANDFDLEALRKKRISIYVATPSRDLGRVGPLMNLFFQQVVDLNGAELPEDNSALKYQLLLLIDEFRSLGKVQVIAESIAYLRGYGIRLMPIFQSPSQVIEVYGEHAAKTFFQNHHLRIIYTPADYEVAADISRELGNQTFKAKSRSNPVGFAKGNRSENESDQARALLLPQEVAQIGDDEEIILAKGSKPIMASKIRWYSDPTFKDCVVPAPEVPVAPMPEQVAIEHGNDEDDAGEQTVRPVAASDLDTLYERPASDFAALDALSVEVPTGELTEDQAEDLADMIWADLTK